MTTPVTDPQVLVNVSDLKQASAAIEAVPALLKRAQDAEAAAKQAQDTLASVYKQAALALVAGGHVPQEKLAHTEALLIKDPGTYVPQTFAMLRSGAQKQAAAVGAGVTLTGGETTVKRSSRDQNLIDAIDAIK